jgi:hypothetical protein
MINTEYVDKGLQRLHEIESLLDGDFFAELSDRQEEFNSLHYEEVNQNLKQYTDAEANLIWIADSMDYYKERIKDLQKVLRNEMTVDEADRRILSTIMEKAELINEIVHQEPMIIDGIPHYKLHIGDSSNDSQQLMDLASQATEIIVDHLDYSHEKASVAFWTNGIPELIYISTFTLNDDGVLEENRDMSSSTI